MEVGWCVPAVPLCGSDCVWAGEDEDEDRAVELVEGKAGALCMLLSRLLASGTGWTWPAVLSAVPAVADAIWASWWCACGCCAAGLSVPTVFPMPAGVCGLVEGRVLVKGCVVSRALGCSCVLIPRATNSKKGIKRKKERKKRW